MSKSYKKHSDEFKNRAVQDVLTGGLTLSEVGRKYEVSPALVKYWCQKAQGIKPVQGRFQTEEKTQRERELEKEVERLKVKVADQVMELDLLKKLSSWVQKKRELDTDVITASNLDRYRKGAK